MRARLAAPERARDAERRSTNELLKTADGLFDVRPAVESTQPEIALAGCSKPAPGRADQVDRFEQLVEERPTVDAAGRLQPGVGSIDAAVDGDADGFQPLPDQPGVFEIERD